MAEFAAFMIIIIFITLSMFGIATAVYMLQDGNIWEAFLVISVTTAFSIIMIGIVGLNYERYSCSCDTESIEQTEGGSEK